MTLPRDWEEMSVEALYSALNYPHRHPTPHVVVEAILYCVKERGLASIEEPANIERLARCEEAAKIEIKRRIEKLGLLEDA